MGQKTTAQTLRAQLMAPEPVQRVNALHALELELVEASPHAVAEELEAFAARGIPYYAPDGPAYREWVGKAVAYWEQLHAPKSVPRMTSARARRAA
ncbi:hypothetical protein [Aquabacterium sp.]|uniref:hypothetical protein n=1 Tax=Aquabacterium sp. TaxID=1872578 RepID=UPI0019C6AFA6|nr:hypothetical protein [Aquabacterium sp.]MBC7700486.1 hypothetical protein [Aquabacterium sp.]